MGHEGARSGLVVRVLALVLVPLAAGGCAANPPSRPEVPVMRGFRNPRSSQVAASTPKHRARDRIVAVGEPQWIVGKFAYGALDRDLVGEEVEVAARPEGARDFSVLGVVTGGGSMPTPSRLSLPLLRSRSTSSPSPSCGCTEYASQAPSFESVGVAMVRQASVSA